MRAITTAGPSAGAFLISSSSTRGANKASAPTDEATAADRVRHRHPRPLYGSDRRGYGKQMAIVWSVLWVGISLVAAIAIPTSASAPPPTLSPHQLRWRSGPVRRERLQWWALSLAFATTAGAVVFGLIHAAAVAEAAHGTAPHDHFALSEGILTAEPAAMGLLTLLPPEVWLLPIPAWVVAALAAAIGVINARWHLIGRSDRLRVQRGWPWRSHDIPWDEITEVYAAGATLHIETARQSLALRADGGELDVPSVAQWIASARDQAQHGAWDQDGRDLGPLPEIRGLLARGRAAARQES